jgi:recombinational DNA repair ATPase RecF
LTVQGFRGFNEERTVDFHECLTLIYAPNSYGKTSISEALEWLLYGVTSKVEKADSKDEYKGSYRNRHFPESLCPFVKVRFVEGDKESVFTGELTGDDSIRRFVGEGETRIEVDKWPLVQDIHLSPRPFILQHALKYLLLTSPDDRFQGFARLLGLEDLDEIHRNIISLCTAPERRIPAEVKELQSRVSSLEARLASRPTLSSLQKVFKRKNATLAEIYDAVTLECQERVPVGTGEESLLPQLLKIREEAVGKVFKGRIALPDYSSIEKQKNSEDGNLLVTCLTDAFIREYTELVALANVEQILKRAQFFGLGTEFLKESPRNCPFCSQSVDDALAQHILAEHRSLVEQAKYGEVLEKQRARVKETLRILKDRLVACQTRHTSKVQSLLELADSLQELKTILVPKYEMHFQKVEAAISDLSAARGKIGASYQVVVDALEKVMSSVATSTEDLTLMQTLGNALVQYVSDIHHYADMVSERATVVSDADQVLQHELDILAGTEDISLLIDFIDQRPAVAKRLEIETILSSLKELRKTVDQYVATRMLSAITGELTSEVMEWYEQIKTTGDPDVHFDGFDMERTQKGEIKARRVSIKAKSYGEALVSAVSSLSESKLNALGLCVSIATNLKGQSPFEFLIIDDPIQSLDVEHETQFIQVIQALVEKSGKQVILLSHNRRWLDQVCAGCRSLNGWFYEITGYTQVGPHLSLLTWQKWQERLKVVNAILKDPEAGTVKLQQAEEEIRIVVAELTSELYRKKRGVQKSPHSLNSAEVERILTECGVRTNLVNQIVQTFCTTDGSHHAPADYCPDRERIRRYHSWSHELAKLLN